MPTAPRVTDRRPAELPPPEEAADLLVAGGGLGGLATALASARRGWRVTLIEGRQQPAIDRWGLTLWPPALRVLDQLGVGDEVRRHGTVLDSLRWLGGDGREWVRIDTQQIVPAGFVGVLPSVVERILTSAAREAGVTLLAGCRLEDVERQPSAVIVAVRGADGASRRLAARILVAADGPDSLVRRLVGLRCRSIRIPTQYVYTGIGGPLPFQHLCQIVGSGWSLSAVPMGTDRSWLAVAAHAADGMSVLRHYAEAVDPKLRDAVEGLQQAWTLRPASGHVRRWAAGRVVLMGEAAHALVPHLGLGGSQTLGDVPALVQVLEDARADDLRAPQCLDRFRTLRRRPVHYAQRISLIWALVSPGALGVLRLARDANLRRLRRRPERMAQFLRELVDHGVPRWRTRVAVWMP